MRKLSACAMLTSRRTSLSFGDWFPRERGDRRYGCLFPQSVDQSGRGRLHDRPGMARFGAGCSPTAAPQRIRNKARFARLRGGVPTDQLRDAQPRKTAWQDRDKDRERQLSSHLAIRVGYWRTKEGPELMREGKLDFIA